MGVRLKQANVPNHSEVCNTAKHHLARIRRSIATRIVDHQSPAVDTGIELTLHKAVWGIILVNPTNQSSRSVGSVELGTRLGEVSWPEGVCLRDDSGGCYGLESSPVTSHDDSGLDVFSEVVIEKLRLH